MISLVSDEFVSSNVLKVSNADIHTTEKMTLKHVGRKRQGMGRLTQGLDTGGSEVRQKRENEASRLAHLDHSSG